MENKQITIDGPAASGKSTVAKQIAKKLNGFYINTGEMFRTLGWIMLNKGLNRQDNEKQIIEILATMDLSYNILPGNNLQLLLNKIPVPIEEIRKPEVAQAASDVATIAEVREWMKEQQRKTASLGTIIMEGRDIGTVIFPQAKYKFFVTASPIVRAQRRFDQGEVPPNSTVESVAKDIEIRDYQDMNRPIAPLKPADDAKMIITDDYTIEEVVDLVVSMIK